MKEKPNTLFIGRFQPLHNGSLDAIKQIQNQVKSDIIIGIGSACKERTSQNPFNYEERKKLFKTLIQSKDSLQNILSTDNIYPIPDQNNDQRWYEYIQNNLPDFEYIASGNPHVLDIFEKHNKKTIKLQLRVNSKGSNIRNQLAINNTEKLKTNLPKPVLDKLKDLQAHKTIKKLYQEKFVSPKLAVDGIITNDQNQVLLIERKNYPKWYALPWGFVDYGETMQKALRRELQEELSIECNDIQFNEMRDEPDRDPRGHIVSMSYKIQTDSKPQAGDDALTYKRIDIQNLDNINIAFSDHKEMIQNAIKN